MLQFIKNLFKKPFQLTHVSLITGHVADILLCFDEEYMHDKNKKNQAIDAVVMLLNEHKDLSE